MSRAVATATAGDGRAQGASLPRACRQSPGLRARLPARLLLLSLLIAASGAGAQITAGGQPAGSIQWDPVTPSFSYEGLALKPGRQEELGRAGAAEGVTAVEPAHRLHLHVHADGTLEETALRTLTRLDTGSFAEPAEIAFAVDAAAAEATITQAYALAPDGSRREIDPAVIRVSPASDEPLFSRLSTVVVPFPETPPGTVNVLVTRTVQRPGDHGLPWSRVYHPQSSVPRESFQLLVTWDAGISAPAIRTDDPDLACMDREPREILCRAAGLAAFAAAPSAAIPDGQPGVVVAQPTTWQELGTRLAAMIDTAADQGGAVDEALANLFADAGIRDLARGRDNRMRMNERLARLHTFVSEDILNPGPGREGGGLVPRPTAITLARRFGDASDKAALFVDMARRAGFRAYAVLTSMQRRDPDRLLIPAIAWFDHMVACAGVPGSFEHCVDLTDPNSPPGVRAGVLNGGIRLDLTASTEAPATFATSRYDVSVSVQHRRELRETGEIRDRQRVRFLSGYGVRQRGVLRAKSRDQREAGVIEAFQRHIRDAADPEIRISGLDDTAEPVTIDIRARYRDAFDPDAPLDFALREPWLAYEIANLPTADPRSDFAFPGFRFLGRSSVRLPPDHRLIALGPTIKFETEFGSMTRRYAVSGEQVEVETIIDMPAIVVGQAQLDLYNRFLDVILSNATIRIEASPLTLN